jgi:hypothetical protein
MTTTEQPTIEETPPEQRPQQDTGTATWWRLLVLRLHFYVGVFVGPFLLVAATSGALYALSPQLEPLLYDRELHVAATDSPLPLSAQIAAARAVEPGSELLGVRPAPQPGDTTRVLCSRCGHGQGRRPGKRCNRLSPVLPASCREWGAPERGGEVPPRDPDSPDRAQARCAAERVRTRPSTRGVPTASCRYRWCRPGRHHPSAAAARRRIDRALTLLGQ